VTCNQVTLHFDGDVHITLEGPYSYQDRNGEVESDAQSAGGKGVLGLLRLLGQSIVQVNAGKDGTLGLEFPAEAWLNCLDTPHYESYHVRLGKRVITV
jgi:hypothetical protein